MNDSDVGAAGSASVVKSDLEIEPSHARGSQARAPTAVLVFHTLAFSNVVIYMCHLPPCFLTKA